MADYASLYSNAQVAFVTDHSADLGGAAFGTFTTLLVKVAFSPGSKQTPAYMVDRADYYYQRMLFLIENHGELFSQEQLVEVRDLWRKAKEVKQVIEGENDLKRHQIWMKKRQYKNLMKDCFAAAKRISDHLRGTSLFSRVDTRNLEGNTSVTLGKPSPRNGAEVGGQNSASVVDERSSHGVQEPLVMTYPPTSSAQEYVSVSVLSSQSREKCVEALTSVLSQDASQDASATLEPVPECDDIDMLGQMSDLSIASSPCSRDGQSTAVLDTPNPMDTGARVPAVGQPA